VSRVVVDVRKEAIIGHITYAGERWRRRRSEAESGTPSEEAFEPGTIGSVRVAPPGLRCIRQFGDNRGLEDVVNADVWEAVLPQCTQREQCFGAR
jgi:hypothetical protein